MKIAIIGAGNVGTALGSGWGKSGHEISYGVRKPDDKKYSSLRQSQPSAKLLTNDATVRQADVVVLSTPWDTTESAIHSCGDLSGKIVIDATNPICADFSGLDRGFDTSGGEQVAQWAKGARVFKAMNQVGFGLMDHPQLMGGKRPVMFIAGGDDGKETVLELVGELGFEAIDAGGLELARLLEPMAWLWIHLATKRSMGVDFAFGLMRKAS